MYNVLHFTPPYTTCVTNKLHNLQGFKKNKNCIFLIELPRAIENSIRGRLSDTFVGKLKTPCFKESNTCTNVEWGLFNFFSLKMVLGHLKRKGHSKDRYCSTGPILVLVVS